MRLLLAFLMMLMTGGLMTNEAVAADKAERDVAGRYFYNPTDDPIPWQPEGNRHGPDYDIPDAPWKREADERIDRIRKRDVTLTVRDQAGAPLKGAPVRFELKRHHFRFGAVATPGFGTGPNGKQKRQYFLKYMTAAGFGMGLKPTQCPEPGCRGRKVYPFRQAAEADLAWLRRHDIEVRGHALIWEGKKFLGPALKAIEADASLSDAEKGAQLYARARAHFPHAIRKWDVVCWDVANEPRANHLIDDLVPERDTFVEWFKLAWQLRRKYRLPGVQLYYNENNVLSWTRYKSYEENRDIYRRRIEDLLRAEAPLEGIGFQFRFKEPLSPETVWKRMREFEGYGLPMQATEFELVSAPHRPFGWDAASRKKMTAEMMTVFFSHPLADGFWHWSWTDRDPEMNRRLGKSFPHALFTWDGKPNAEMEQWMKMMEVDFNTDVTGRTDVEGCVSIRGFKGIYLVTVGMGKGARQFTVTLQDDLQKTLRL